MPNENILKHFLKKCFKIFSHHNPPMDEILSILFGKEVNELVNLKFFVVFLNSFGFPLWRLELGGACRPHTQLYSHLGTVTAGGRLPLNF